MHNYFFMHKINSMHEKPHQSPTVSEQALLSLRGDILLGRHAPGAKLKLEQLQTTYGFSSSPLREALNRLSQEGLVNADERKGFRVAPISPEDLADITRMRLMLDVQALRDAMRTGNDAWEANIVAAFHRLEKIESRLSSGPVVLDAEWSHKHRDFHLSLMAACPSARQLAWTISLFDQAERYRQFSARHRQVAKRKDEEHRTLMQAVIRRDEDTACALLAEHIQSTQRNVLDAFKTV